MPLLSFETVKSLFLLKQGSWLCGFFASDSDREIRKSEVTKVIVDDETELLFPPCNEVDFLCCCYFEGWLFACCFQLFFALGPVLIANLELLPLWFLS